MSEKRYCHDERHDIPCPEGCTACTEECDKEWMLTEAEARERGIAWDTEHYQ